MSNVSNIIQKLGLLPHPEGGFYKEVYRSEGKHPFAGTLDFPQQRNYCTSIYFLLTAGNFSAFHRIRSDETWHFYDGQPAQIVEIDLEGKLILTTLGSDLENGQVFQYTVAAGHWFGSSVLGNGDYSLTGCTVAPGFDFRDFELADRDELLSKYPDHQDVIIKFTRK